MTEYRTAKGDLSAKALKAIQWYALEHRLKLTASSPLPAVWFKDGDGEIVKTTMEDVLDAYAEFKKSTHGRKKTAA